MGAPKFVRAAPGVLVKLVRGLNLFLIGFLIRWRFRIEPEYLLDIHRHRQTRSTLSILFTLCPLALSRTNARIHYSGETVVKWQNVCKTACFGKAH